MLSRLGRLGSIVSSPAGSGAEPQPQTLSEHFVRNSVRFCVCFSALSKLAVRDNNTKNTRKCNWVDKVMLHVWTSNWGQRPRKL